VHQDLPGYHLPVIQGDVCSDGSRQLFARFATQADDNYGLVTWARVLARLTPTNASTSTPHVRVVYGPSAPPTGGRPSGSRRYGTRSCSVEAASSGAGGRVGHAWPSDFL
jgi:hypothetical protein